MQLKKSAFMNSEINAAVALVGPGAIVTMVAAMLHEVDRSHYWVDGLPAIT